MHWPVTTNLFAQTEVTSLSLEHKHLKGMQVLHLGDTLFVSMDTETITNNFLVLPDGTQRRIIIPLRGKSILHIENFGDSLLVYYAVGNKRSVTLKALSWNSISGTSRELPGGMKLNSRIWASYKKDGLRNLR